MIRVDQLRERLQHLAEGHLTLDEFDDWFAGTSWDMQKTSSHEAMDLAGKVELYLAEYDGDHISEGMLRERLRDLVPTLTSTR